MPPAYIAILLDTTIQQQPDHDAGIAAMSISLIAAEAGLGTCILGAIDRKQLRGLFHVPDTIDIVLLIAVGYAKTKPITDRVETGNIRYWIDDTGQLHVPKRTLAEVLSWNTYQQS